MRLVVSRNAVSFSIPFFTVFIPSLSSYRLGRLEGAILNVRRRADDFEKQATVQCLKVTNLPTRYVGSGMFWDKGKDVVTRASRTIRRRSAQDGLVSAQRTSSLDVFIW